ncbi:hypothetical protein [Nostoc sp.]
MGLSLEEIYSKAKSLRGVMVPLTLESKRVMLRETRIREVGGCSSSRSILLELWQLNR